MRWPEKRRIAHLKEDLEDGGKQVDEHRDDKKIVNLIFDFWFLIDRWYVLTKGTDQKM